MMSTIAFQGRPGAYSDLACRNAYPEWRTLPCETFDAAMQAVRSGQAGLAMVAIENSLAGRVPDMHQLLPESGLFVVGEAFQRVEHCLLVPQGATIAGLKRAHSHAVALGQVRNILAELKLQAVVEADTAGAAEQGRSRAWRRRPLRALRGQSRRLRPPATAGRDTSPREYGDHQDPGGLRHGARGAARGRIRPKPCGRGARAMPHEAAIWKSVGRDRLPGRARERLTVAFLGSAYPHKGPQLLVEAAQLTAASLDVRIIGEVPPQFEERLRALDRRGAVTLSGRFDPSQIGQLLRDVDVAVLPSMWWDCAPLAAAECLAARTPLVVPELGGLPESIRDGIDGLIFNALDAADLARVLDRLDAEPGLLEQRQANIRAPRPFSEYVDELEAYYLEAGRAARSPRT